MALPIGYQQVCAVLLRTPPLKPLHRDESLLPLKLATIRSFTTSNIIDSLQPGQTGALKTRPDGTILDGHHRIYVLRERGVVVDDLPREVIAKLPMDGLNIEETDA
jgi:hypothetical protein